MSQPITSELYDTKSYYQLIVPITKCENLSLGIFITVRNRFQSKKMTGCPPIFLSNRSWTAYLVTIIVSLILIGYHVPFSKISLASGICYLIFIGSLTVRFDLCNYKVLVIGQVRSTGLLRTNHIQAFYY